MIKMGSTKDLLKVLATDEIETLVFVGLHKNGQVIHMIKDIFTKKEAIEISELINKALKRQILEMIKEL